MGKHREASVTKRLEKFQTVSYFFPALYTSEMGQNSLQNYYQVKWSTYSSLRLLVYYFLEAAITNYHLGGGLFNKNACFHFTSE